MVGLQRVGLQNLSLMTEMLTCIRSLFATKSARWRSLQVILMGVAGQFSGNGLGYFNTEVSYARALYLPP